MNISKAAFGFLVAGLVAGAGGAYMATRSDAPAAVAAEQESASLAPVEHSEEIVTEIPDSAETPVADVPVAAPVRVASAKPVERLSDRPRVEDARSSAPPAEAPVEAAAPQAAAAEEPPAEGDATTPAEG